MELQQPLLITNSADPSNPNPTITPYQPASRTSYGTIEAPRPSSDHVVMVQRPSQDEPRLGCKNAILQFGIQPSSPVAWFGDGRILAFVSGSNGIYIARKSDNAETFSIHTVLTGHDFGVHSLLFHPSQPILVSGGVEGIYIWDLTTMKLKKKIGIHIETAGAQATATTDAHEGPVEVLCWMYGGTALVSGSRDSTVRVWDVLEDFALLETITGHKAPVLCLVWSEKTNLLASAGRDSAIKIWETRTLAPSFRAQRKTDKSIMCVQHSQLDGHRGDVISLLWCQDGLTLFSGARDNIIKVWDLISGKCMRDILGHRGDIRALVLLNEERFLLSCAMDSKYILWEVAQHRRPEVKEVTSMSAEAILADSISETALVEKDKMLSQMQIQDNGISAMAINPAFSLMVDSGPLGCVRIHNILQLGNPVLRQEFVGHNEAVTQVTLLAPPGGPMQIISASKDYNINIYDCATQRREASLPFGGSVQALAIHPSHQMVIAGGTDYPIKGFSLIRDATLYHKIAMWEGHCGAVNAIAISPDGRVLCSAGHDFNLKVWPILEPSRYFNPDAPQVHSPSDTIDVHGGRITSLAFDEKGTRLASSSTDHSIVIYSVSGRNIRPMYTLSASPQETMSTLPGAHASVVSCVTWGLKGCSHLLFSSSWDRSISVWQPPTRSTNAPIPIVRRFASNHRAHITQIAMAKTGVHLVSVDAEGGAYVWSSKPDDFGCVAKYRSRVEGCILSCAAGENEFVTGSEAGMVQMWPLPTPANQAHFVEAKDMPDENGRSHVALSTAMAPRPSAGRVVPMAGIIPTSMGPTMAMPMPMAMPQGMMMVPPMLPPHAPAPHPPQPPSVSVTASSPPSPIVPPHVPQLQAGLLVPATPPVPSPGPQPPVLSPPPHHE